IYAAFPVVKVTELLKSFLEPFLPDLGVAVWTTTPWTIPGNLAVAVNGALEYWVVEVSHPDAEARKECKYLIVAADLVADLATKLNMQLTVKAK
ncbi:MAG: hypothetical protein ACKPB9_22490, partial [Dolichospermum sp.]